MSVTGNAESSESLKLASSPTVISVLNLYLQDMPDILVGPLEGAEADRDSQEPLATPQGAVVIGGGQYIRQYYVCHAYVPGKLFTAKYTVQRT